MKNNRYILPSLSGLGVLIISMMMLAFPSCQDMEQNPPFDYPEQPVPPPIGADGQIFYMDFEDNYEEYQSLNEATVVGSPGFATGIKGNAYAGANDSYLTFETDKFASALTPTMTFSFWYKVNSNPNRAGLLVLGPETEGAPADQQNNRTSGIRIFREDAAGKQRLKAIVGNGVDDSWIDGGDKADLDAENPTWKFIALVLTKDKAIFYIDGEEVAAANFSGISWKGSDIMSIGSGSPRFNEWGHKSDNSLIDELRIYNKALSASDIKAKFQAK